MKVTQAKLQRETARLSQIQDIAGFRITVLDTGVQDEAARLVAERFSGAKIHDLRDAPHCGYRAVHAVLPIDGRVVELQLRTQLQDLWANLSEVASDRFGLEVKYCGGPLRVRQLLDEVSDYVRTHEDRLRIAERFLFGEDHALSRGANVGARAEASRSLLLLPDETVPVWGRWLTDLLREERSLVSELLDLAHAKLDILQFDIEAP